MGSICSKSKNSVLGGAVVVDNGGVSERSRQANGHCSDVSGVNYQSQDIPGKVKSDHVLSSVDDNDDDVDRQVRESFSFPEREVSHVASVDDINDGIPHLSRVLSYKSRSSKSKQAAATKVCFIACLIFVFLFLSFVVLYSLAIGLWITSPTLSGERERGWLP